MTQTTLFVKRRNSQPTAVREEAFQSKQKFEDYICENSNILSDVFIIRRQVRANRGADIPDIVGVDKDRNIVLIEMKNSTVDEHIISQVLRYAIWAETNPDSVKSMWLECQNRPDDLDIDWGDNEVRIIVVAPQIGPKVPAFATRTSRRAVRGKPRVRSDDGYAGTRSTAPLVRHFQKKWGASW